MTDMLLVLTHVAAGVTALFVTPVAMIVRKGGRAHRRWGKIYFWAMFTLFLSALALLLFRPNLFLLIISIFSFYGALSGYRALSRKRPLSGQGAKPFDYAAALVTLASGLGFVIWGALPLLGLSETDVPSSFLMLGLVFGLAIMQTAGGDLRSFIRPSKDRNQWWFDHMAGMLGSYIAAVTAFLVQNMGPRLGSLSWIVWVAPGVIGAVLIGYWIGYYRRKFAIKPRGLESRA